MTLTVYTFSPAWNLPTSGPFALKLLAWLELAGIAYQQAIEDNPRKGPHGKSPWIELDGERIGDSETIIALLSERHHVDLDEGLSPEQKAIGHAWRRMFEEHVHQVLEWELMVHPAGREFIRSFVAASMPPLVGAAASVMLTSHFRRQLHARGIARHAPDVIAAKGRADLDALSAFLGDRPFLLRDRPASADAAVFGQLAPLVYWPMATPVATHARSIANLANYCERLRELCFTDKGTAERVLAAS